MTAAHNGMETDIVWLGEVNGEAVFMRGRLERSAGEVQHFEGKFEQLPDSFTPAALGLSGICYQCLNSAPARSHAVSLSELTGGNFTAYRGFKILQENRPVGFVTVDGQTRKMTGQKHINTTIIRGDYQGPTDIIEIGPYLLLLKKTGVGTLSGTYTQTIKTGQGRELLIEAKASYSYDEAVFVLAVAPSAVAFVNQSGLTAAISYLKQAFSANVLSFDIRATVMPPTE